VHVDGASGERERDEAPREIRERSTNDRSEHAARADDAGVID